MMKTSFDFNIRAADVRDAELLHELSITTFIDTYALYNTPEDMQTYIQQYFSIQTLRNELENNANFFFITMKDNMAVGYVKLRTSQEQEKLSLRKAIELERIYVRNELHGTGLGYRLIQKSIAFAKENNYDIIWLGVWKRNEKAIKFHTKCGFEIFDEHIFILGKDEQVDWLMKKELKD